METLNIKDLPQPDLFRLPKSACRKVNSKKYTARFPYTQESGLFGSGIFYGPFYDTKFGSFAYLLLGGGLFLITKSTYEIHDKLEITDHKQHDMEAIKKVSITGVVIQVVLVDIVFSLDSVITAVGIANVL